MVPIILLLFLFNVLSLVILGASGWLGWSWYQGELIADPDGTVTRVREDWRLWTALALLAWSFLGRRALLPLLARKDHVASMPVRIAGARVQGVDGAELYVETLGPAGAPTVILTHGWGMDSTIWNYAKSDLSRRFRVVTWDLPGLGESKAGKPNGVSLTAFAANLRALIKDTGGPVVLVGHSIGGMTIQTLARDYPEMLGREVVGLVLINTTHINPLRTIILSPFFQAIRLPVLTPLMMAAIVLQPLVWLSAWQSYLSGMAHVANRFGFGRFVTRSQLDHTTLLMTRNPPGVQARGNLAMFGWDATAALPTIPVPVLVIGGDMDIVTRLEASRTIAGAIPHAHLQVVEGVNHMGFLERADVYNMAVASFIDGIRVRVSPYGQAVG
ncbi:alpha/beta fold hydrolase [Brevundimonas sp.]|uniref:alpha/beta fold hydrolase n=1 Tax=Brevundimonas sp. TaxID=1871086 RepID=UPI00391CE297